MIKNSARGFVTGFKMSKIILFSEPVFSGILLFISEALDKRMTDILIVSVYAIFIFMVNFTVSQLILLVVPSVHGPQAVLWIKRYHFGLVYSCPVIKTLIRPISFTLLSQHIFEINSCIHLSLLYHRLTFE